MMPLTILIILAAAAASQAPPLRARRLTASSADSLVLADVKASYGISLRGPVTPIQSTEHLEAELQHTGSQEKALALMPGAGVAPCAPLEVPTGAHVTLDCGGNTLDLRCVSASLTVRAGAQLTLVQCHVLWPSDRPFLSQSGSSSVLGDGAQLNMLRGSSSLHCPVRFR
jgi:hypothetical protein